MSAEEHKQYDFNHKTFVHSTKYIKLKHIEAFLQFFAIIFLISFEMLISNMIHLAKFQSATKF